jgi:amino acid transporter
MADTPGREPEERPAPSGGPGVVRIEDTEATHLNRVITRPMLTFFILGDILGAGIYALTGQVAGDVGGAIWASFLVSFLLALVTAFAYLELVTKYPRAAGAALYVHRAYRAAADRGLPAGQHHRAGAARDPVAHHHFVAPGILPVLGALVAGVFLLPIDRDAEIYLIAIYLLIGGLLLWAVNFAFTRRPGTVVAEEADLTPGPGPQEPPPR